MRKLYTTEKLSFSSYVRTKHLFWLLTVALAFIVPMKAWTQTNPTAQSLPYTQDFTTFTGSTTTYPAGIQGWGITGSTGTAYPTTAPASDQALTANSNTSTSAFVGDMNGKIGFLSTGSAIKTIALSIITTSNTNILVSYLAATQRQESGARIGAIGLQYRVGTTGTFTNVTGTDYQNPGGSSTTTGTSSLNPQTISVTLPVACENQPIVQLRWVYKEVSGSGNRPSFSIDDINITGTPGTSSPSVSVSSTSISGFLTNSGTASANKTIDVSGSNLSSDISINVASGPFEISTSASGPFSASVTLSQSGGTVSNTTVYTRIAASASPALSVTGQLSMTSGTASQTVTLNGAVTSASAPAIPGSLSATSISTSEIDLSATANGTGSDILVAFNTSATFGTPSGTLAIGNSISGGGSVLYKGPASGFTNYQHTGLNGATTYYYSAWSVDAYNTYSSSITANAITTAPAVANVVINQIYGGGGNSGAYYKNDFIELYNNENIPVSLNGWSLQYSSAAGTGTWTVHTLSGSIPPHSFFLVQESAGTGGTANLPGPDITNGSLALSATAGKVILSNAVTALSGANPTGATVIDKVGYGSTATGFETAPAPGTDNTTAIVRISDGVDNNNNSTDFVTADPLPRNSTYKTSAPTITALNPPTGATNIPYNIVPSFSFNKQVVKGAGSITIFENGVAGTPINITSSSVVLTAGKTVTINTTFTGGKSYYIQITPGSFKDVYGNDFVGITDATSWAFTTHDPSVVVNIPVTFDFQACTGNGLLPDGFTQYSAAGGAVWDCTAYGRDPAAPQGTAAYPNGVQMNGYDNVLGNVVNVDWLISPTLNLTGSIYPLLSFYSRTKFNGQPLQLKISTDYSGTGDPSLATWTDLNGRFPNQTTDTWTLSSNINLSDFKQSNIHIAFVYTSTTDDGARWTLDDISIINSATPPPPSLTVSTSDINFPYTLAGSSSTKQFTVIGNDLAGGGGINLVTTGSFQVSKDNITFNTTVNLTEAEANNVTRTIYVKFVPGVNNKNYTGTLNVSTAGTTDTTLSLYGTSIDPEKTLEIVNWNMEWFGSSDVTLGPANKAQQKQNVQTILPALGADLYALVEVVDTAALGQIVRNNMPGYDYRICNYGSHANPYDPIYSPMSAVQKEAFVYKTSVFSNVDTATILSQGGVNLASDIGTTNYNNWSSGRYPFRMKADVTLNGVTKTMYFIAIHAKANTSPTLTAYNRRKGGADSLYKYINNNLLNENVVILGDFNDDLDVTITDGITPNITSYSSFTNDANYYSPTLNALSLTGKKSTAKYNDVIDHVVVTNTMKPYYMINSTVVLNDVTSLVANYASTTSDHYPIFTRYAFDASILPITLTDFTAVKQQSSVKLTWKSAEENNGKEYVIERSADGSKYNTIGTVTAKGTASDYSFIDASPLIGTNYYRLKMVDQDGTYKNSKVAKVSFSKQLQIKISPNPATTYVNVISDNLSEPLVIEVIDVNGRIVKQLAKSQNQQQISVSLAGLPKGFYTLKVIGTSEVHTQKLLIQ